MNVGAQNVDRNVSFCAIIRLQKFVATFLVRARFSEKLWQQTTDLEICYELLNINTSICSKEGLLIVSKTLAQREG